MMIMSQPLPRSPPQPQPSLPPPPPPQPSLPPPPQPSLPAPPLPSLLCLVGKPLGEESAIFVVKCVYLASLSLTTKKEYTLLVIRSAVNVECFSPLTLNSHPTRWLIMNNRVAGPVVPRKTTYGNFSAKISLMIEVEMGFDVLAAEVESIVEQIRQTMELEIMEQGALAQTKSNYQGNQFPYATEADPKAVVAPISNGCFNCGRGFHINRMRVAGPIVQRKTTYVNFTYVKVCSYSAEPRQEDNAAVLKQTLALDARFAKTKEQRMRALSQQNNNGVRRNGGGPQRQQQ